MNRRHRWEVDEVFLTKVGRGRGVDISSWLQQSRWIDSCKSKPHTARETCRAACGSYPYPIPVKTLACVWGPSSSQSIGSPLSLSKRLVALTHPSPVDRTSKATPAIHIPTLLLVDKESIWGPSWATITFIIYWRFWKIKSAHEVFHLLDIFKQNVLFCHEI